MLRRFWCRIAHAKHHRKLYACATGAAIWWCGKCNRPFSTDPSPGDPA